ncbi:isopenicillin N synthase family dioxygenase [Pedomonas mirosovicensis]|uniref:isopenicillin N synthase family dioxygenase n=1 Tax=Pedomonas mirosovicensis TaxID=2908641 RepID=UPI0021694E3B|nr:2OG-Fe(II) oxygenase family protein [Pedomonas mirosovicensis]MCH8686119.1 isopenicillin N synthase family oxygenase [Pedomonas mirosovicensis]
MTSAIPPVSYHLYDADFPAFARALGESYARYGFAVVSDHGLPGDLIEGTLARFKTFFAWPEEAKQRYHRPGLAGARGYTPFGIETAKGAKAHDLKEFWHMGRELPPGHAYRAFMPENVWVEEIDGFREAAYGLYAALDGFGQRMLRAIAQYLGLAPDFFDARVNAGNSLLRVLHYPPVPEDAAGAVRAAAHEDINVITLLLGAEEGGLEILTKDGRWLPINPPPGCIVVNIGDMLQRMTNHVLPSTTHRVVNPPPERARRPRYSMPFFLHFNPDVVIEPLPGCVSPDNPSRYPEPITAQDYLEERLREIRLL